ncbi:MAG: oligosaccharide flippase family protein [Bryobacteraceae bacterium]
MSRIFTFTQFSTATELGRAEERNRRVVLSVGSSAAARGVAVAAAFITVPLTIGYLGTERYGMWMTITSITAMLSFSDFGIGSGLVGLVARSSGLENRGDVARGVSSAFYILIGIAASMIALLGVSYNWVPWPRALNLTSPLASTEAGPAAVVFIACFALNLPLGVVQRVQIGYQETFVSNLWQIGGTILGFCALLTAIHFKAGLPWLVAALSGGPVVVNAANMTRQFTIERPWLFPAWQSFNWGCSKQLLRMGLAFFVIQIASTVIIASDNIIIAQVLGPSDVATFSVGIRLFVLPQMICQMVCMPLWPAYGEAFARRDLAWMRRTLRKTTLLGLSISVFLGTMFVLLGPKLTLLWTRGRISLSYTLLIGLGASTVAACSTYPYGVFLFGVNALRFSTITMSIVAVSSVLLKLLWAPTWGLPGVAWGTAIPYLLLNSLPAVLYATRLLARNERMAATTGCEQHKPQES